MIVAEAITKSFGGPNVLDGVDLEVGRRDVVSVIGPSGSGKSTFLRCLNRLEEPTAGKIFFNGENILDRSYSVDQLRMRMGMVFQHFNLFPHMSVMENLTLGPTKLNRKNADESREIASALLRKVGLIDKANASPKSLSGGQKQRVAIARSLAMQPEAMLFDEPTSALDPEMVNEVLGVIRELAEEGMTMIIVTHEMAFAREVSSQIAFMDRGKILELSKPAEFFSEPRQPRAREFLAKVL